MPAVVGRDKSKLDLLSGTYGIPVICADIRSKEKNWYNLLGQPDSLVHLAWEGLDDFHSLSHLEDELPHHIFFLKNLCQHGLKRVIVGGTCFEYGKREGELAEDMSAVPVISYAIAKNTLRLYLEKLSDRYNFSLVWLRYFYMHGAGQSKNTLFSQLESALARGDAVFNMSGGEQLRDYLPVEEVARLTAAFATKLGACGIFNICSGKPVSIRKLVEQKIEEMGADIKLNFGYYPYPHYEPMAFWGDRGKLDGLLSEKGTL